MYHDIVSKNS